MGDDGSPERDVVVGRVAGVFGTRGWLRIESYTRPRENILRYAPWRLGRGAACQRFELLDSRRHHGGLIVRLAGIDDRDRAATLLRADIVVGREQLGEAAPGEYFWADLVGCSVVNLAGIELGTVSGLLETGAHDVLRVVAERERLIPFVVGVHVREVDLGARRITVDWHEDD